MYAIRSYYEQYLKGAVLDVTISQHRQAGRGADAVVRPQGRPLGANPFAIHIGLNGIPGEVVVRVGIGLGHHVDMRLQDHALAIFHARAGGLLDDEITDLIHHHRQTLLVGPGLDPLAEGRLMLGGVGDGAELGEKAP